MLLEWERRYPGRIDNMAAAMGRITPSHLMDRNLHPFTTLQANGVANADGDKAFDDDACSDVTTEQPLRVVTAPADQPAAP
jgi:tRNA 2-thiocytidine biosynthesis protein TtcA